ncbi:MAG: hypothetical protein U1E49_01460 [Hyphomicrobiaceae bacterium]
MGLQYANLDADTRGRMAAEIEADTKAGTLYISNYLSPRGAGEWPGLLLKAAQEHNDDWLAQQLAGGGRLLQEVEKRKPKGGTTIASVPVTAPSTLAEGEFNRYYVRALCLRANEGSKVVEVYRARASEQPRPESEALIGKRLPATDLLEDLRKSPGVEASLGLARPNSGLSVRLV